LSSRRNIYPTEVLALAIRQNSKPTASRSRFVAG
jgi:hypothetical protein